MMKFRTRFASLAALVIAWPLAINGSLAHATLVANAGGPYDALLGQDIILNGSASFDAGTDPLTFDWDIDGDGVFDNLTGSSPTLTFLLAQSLGITSAGSYLIALRVTDINKAFDTATALLRYSQPVPEPGSLALLGLGLAGLGLSRRRKS